MHSSEMRDLELSKLQRDVRDIEILPLSSAEPDGAFYVFALRVSDEGSVGKRKLSAGKYYYLLDGFTVLEDRVLVSKERFRETVYDYYVNAKRVSAPHITVSAIVGENGSGKSSLVEFEMRLINNFASVVFGEFARVDGRPHLHFIDGVSGELFYLLNQNVYRLSVNGRRVELYCYYRQAREEDGKIVFSKPIEIIGGDPVAPNWPIKSVYALSYFKSLKQLLSHFFYTIVLNQSVYAYNTLDFKAECNSEEYEIAIRKGRKKNEKGEEIPYSVEDKCWLNGLFHKNDGYQIPIVLTPYRSEGNFDINVENRLAYERLISILVRSEEKDRIINGHLRVTSFDLLLSRNLYDLELIHKKVGFKQFTDADFAAMKEILLQVWSKRVGFDILASSHSFIYRDLAINYLVYKTLKIANTYDEYREFRYSYETKSEAFSAEAFEKLVNLTIANYSHVTNKLYRTIAYLIWDIYEKHGEEKDKPVTVLLDEIGAHWVKAIKEKRFDITNFIGSNLILEAAIPPPFFETAIGVVELNDGKYIPFEYLSSGEKQQAYTSSSIVYHLKNLDSVSKDRSTSDRVAYEYVQLILEEVELYYHPELQRQFIRNLLDSIALAGLDHIKWIDICVVTHSPFVLSDIPASNVLALKKDGSDAAHLPSFGANIHEMFKLSFFLDKGTVGEVSQWTITRIAQCLRVYRWLSNIEGYPEGYEDFLEEFKTIQEGMKFSSEGFKLVYPPEVILNQINLIGEPVIRRVLLDDYKRTFPESAEVYKESMRALLQSQLDALK